MKIRQGFVTNSSSSSFIIAKKGNFDKTRLYYEFLNESILDEIVENSEYFNFLQYPENIFYLIEDGKLDEAKKELVKEIVDEIIKSTPDLKLDDWNVNIGTCDNETDCLLNFFLYGIKNDIDLSDFKFERFYC